MIVFLLNVGAIHHIFPLCSFLTLPLFFFYLKTLQSHIGHVGVTYTNITKAIKLHSEDYFRHSSAASCSCFHRFQSVNVLSTSNLHKKCMIRVWCVVILCSTMQSVLFQAKQKGNRSFVWSDNNKTLCVMVWSLVGGGLTDSHIPDWTLHILVCHTIFRTAMWAVMPFTHHHLHYK